MQKKKTKKNNNTTLYVLDTTLLWLSNNWIHWNLGLYHIHQVHKGNYVIFGAKLMNNCIVTEELPVSIGELTVANAVLQDDISTGNLATSINQWKTCYIIIALVSEWVHDCCVTTSEQFFSYSMARTRYIWWDEDAFVLNQHLNVYSASSREQHATGRIIMIPSQSLLLLLNATCLMKKQRIPIL